MKKFFTILWVFIGFVNLYAQTTISPSAVLGDVYVAGPVYSKGAIYIKAENTVATTGKRGAVEVATAGTFSADSIIFYSNENRDGLLRNKGIVKGTSDLSPQYVAVRKHLNSTMGWQHVSFPFDVPFAGNIKSTSGQNLIKGSDFWVYYYDIKERAMNGKVDNSNWYEIGYASNINLRTDALQRGIGYNIWGESAGDELDFITTNQDQIAELFNTAVNKTEALAYYEGPRSINGSAGFTNRYGSGWNLIGGLNSDNFVADVIEGQSTVDFGANLEAGTGYPQTSSILTNGSIYYWRNPGDNSTFAEYSLDPAVAVSQGPLIMSPYVPFFVQTDTILGSLSTHIGRSIVFKGTGNYIAYGNTTNSRTRSLTTEDSEVRDIFSLSLTSSEIENSGDQLFLMFGDMYHEEYVPVEDGIKMTTISSIPRVWSANED
ncbi:MAG: hypothetical protein LBV46_02710, partial [Bacteroidales bacterium]|nr:hypothetical protein [Bacteroidales bacterium]